MHPPLHIRNYQKEDRSRLIALLQLNVPKYFAQSEVADLEHYLDEEIEEYFVAEIAGNIVGAGGINFAEGGKIAKISWDFIHPDFQRMGIGAQLLQHRLAFIKLQPAVEIISVRTSQHAFEFYQKNGFALKEIQKDYWAPGFDMYLMLCEAI